MWLESRMRALPTSYAQKRAGFMQAAPDPKVLVLGASEVLRGVDAAALGAHAYNMANFGQSFYYDKQLLA